MSDTAPKEAEPEVEAQEEGEPQVPHLSTADDPSSAQVSSADLELLDAAGSAGKAGDLGDPDKLEEGGMDDDSEHLLNMLEGTCSQHWLAVLSVFAAGLSTVYTMSAIDSAQTDGSGALSDETTKTIWYVCCAFVFFTTQVGPLFKASRDKLTTSIPLDDGETQAGTAVRPASPTSST